MSDEVKLNLAKVGGIIGILAGIAGLLGAWFVLPYRVTATETEIISLKTRMEMQHEILIRIDENVKQLKGERR